MLKCHKNLYNKDIFILKKYCNKNLLSEHISIIIIRPYLVRIVTEKLGLFYFFTIIIFEYSEIVKELRMPWKKPPWFAPYTG